MKYEIRVGAEVLSLHLPTPSKVGSHPPALRQFLRGIFNASAYGLNLSRFSKSSSPSIACSVGTASALQSQPKELFRFSPLMECITALVVLQRSGTIATNCGDLQKALVNNEQIGKLAQGGPITENMLDEILDLSKQFFPDDFLLNPENFMERNKELYILLTKAYINKGNEKSKSYLTQLLKKYRPYLIDDLNLLLPKLMGRFPKAQYQFIYHPTFALGHGDFIIDGCIYDIKLNARGDNFQMAHFDQLLLYFIYSYLNEHYQKPNYALKGIGLYNPINDRHIKVDLSTLLGHNSLHKLPSNFLNFLQSSAYTMYQFCEMMDRLDDCFGAWKRAKRGLNKARKTYEANVELYENSLAQTSLSLKAQLKDLRLLAHYLQ